jgi:peroxiredoxin/mono/diheme cytochrome c family protein
MIQNDTALSDRSPEFHSPRRRLPQVLMTLALGGAVMAGVAWLVGAISGLHGGLPWLTGVEPQPATEAFAPDLDHSFARGRMVYEARCARCHGHDGHGDGPDAAMIRPPLRDLASASWRSAAVRENVRRVVVDGLPDKGMPGAAGVLSPHDQEAVIDHVLALETTALMARAGFASETGRTAPAVLLRDPTGSTSALERFRGSVVLLAFWGTTCIPCLKELPELERLMDRFQAAGLAVVPVCLDETDPAKARDVAASRAGHLPVYVADGTARESYNVHHLPHAVLVDREGRLLAHASGGWRWEGKEVEEFLCACLGVPFPLRPEHVTGN